MAALLLLVVMFMLPTEPFGLNRQRRLSPPVMADPSDADLRRWVSDVEAVQQELDKLAQLDQQYRSNPACKWAALAFRRDVRALLAARPPYTPLREWPEALQVATWIQRLPNCCPAWTTR